MGTFWGDYFSKHSSFQAILKKKSQTTLSPINISQEEMIKILDHQKEADRKWKSEKGLKCKDQDFW